MRLRRLGTVLLALVVAAACGASVAEDLSTSSTAVEPTSATTAAEETTTTTEALTTTTVAPTIDLATVSADRPVDGWAADEVWFVVVEQLAVELDARDIGAGALAVSVDGVPVLEVGLGWRDLERTEPLAADAAFRLASVTKPYTMALADELVADGVLGFDDQVFCTPASSGPCLLDLTDDVAAAEGELDGAFDERVADITFGQLIDHTAGWDRNVSLDPMFAPLLVQFELGIDELPTIRQTVTWLLAQPLDHDPGTTYAYSNVGYAVAGLAMEEATGRDYLDLLQEHVLGTRGVEAISVGRTLPPDRRADEVAYECAEGMMLDLFDPTRDVCWPDGGFHLEAMEAHGALVGPAGAVLEHLDRYCVPGYPNDQPGVCGDNWFTGSLPGTFAIARNVGRVNWVLLVNRRTHADGSGVDYPEFVELLDLAIGDVTPLWQ